MKTIRPAPYILQLGPDFYEEVTPAKFPKTILRYRNQQAAKDLNLDGLSELEWIQYFALFKPLSQNLQKPLALKYHGHQFRHYNPDLGDGRGFLFAQFLDSHGRILDLGTKGSGQTPYSRAGDGKLTLKGAFREVLATEMLMALGVNTSQTFSVIETGENLTRNDEPSPTRSAVLVRLNHSHIRIGTFQRLAYFQQNHNIYKLIDYCCEYVYPDLKDLSTNNKTLEFFKKVVGRCAYLAAEWMMSGFVHGVLNSDNINISAESFDYGPYRFLPKYDPHFTAAYFDHSGLYSYGRQPSSMYWNLEQLASSLALIENPEALSLILNEYGELFTQSIHECFFKRLGLIRQSKEKNDHLLMQFFTFLSSSEALFEQSFYDLRLKDWTRLENSVQKEKYKSQEFTNLKNTLDQFDVDPNLNLTHTYWQQGSCESLLIEEIENLWAAIDKNDNWQPFNQKLIAIRSMREAYDLHSPLSPPTHS